MHSTELRCEVPWIEMRSTEAFNLNWGDAQTWLGQLLVDLYIFLSLGDLCLLIQMCETLLYLYIISFLLFFSTSPHLQTLCQLSMFTTTVVQYSLTSWTMMD